MANPFRRANSNVKDDASLQIDTGAASEYRETPKSKKKVTIQTPPHSPEDVPRRLSTGRISPPPPTTQIPDEDDDTDSSNTAESELEEALYNTRRNSSTSTPHPSTSVTTNVRAPYNPFARTLATQEAAYGIQQNEGESQEETDGSNVDNAKRGGDKRANLNVDQFKHILLTGSGVPESISNRWRSSNNENAAPTQSKTTPGSEASGAATSGMDSLQSSSESEDESDDESGRSDTEPGRTRPSNVRRGPQTVSFSDFDDPNFATSTTTNSISPSMSKDFQNETRPITLTRSSSDLVNSPSTPPPAISTTIRRKPVPSAATPPFQESNQAERSSITQKKAPPPPPAARRTLIERTRSEPNTSRIDTSREEDIVPPTKSPELPSKVGAPPPPPARKARPLSQNTLAATEPTLRTQSPDAATSTKVARPAPPPRNTSKADNTASTTPSIATRSSETRKETPSLPQSAPPAPPPRRSGINSVRNSVDAHPVAQSTRRRSSEHSVTSERSSSISNLENVSETGETQRNASTSSDTVGSQDILADLTRFQAEIDALRAKSGKPG